MIIEGIVNWFFTVLGYALSLLPENGTLFDTVPDVSLTFIKYVTLMNGYAPLVEFGRVFALTLLIAVSMQVIRVIFGIYNMVTKLIP